MVQAISTGTFCEAKWLVDPTGGQGTHTTIATALTSASSGDTIFIRPGTYTENLTLKVGVNLAAYDCDALTPNVTIVGKCTLTTAGTVSVSGIRLQTNSDFFLAVTGSVASIINLNNCYLNSSNSTGISFTSSSSSAAINITSCKGNIATTGIALFAHSSSGNINIYKTTTTNSGSSVTNSTCSAGGLFIYYSWIADPITVSSTGVLETKWSRFDGINTTTLTLTGTSATHTLLSCNIGAGSASAVSIGVGATASLISCDVNSSNTNTITGSGTLNYTPITFSGTSKGVNTTTQTFQPGS
jgi:hypothetical protein